jgi:hypothetical protein
MEAPTLNLILIKTRKYTLKPFGRFTIVWNCSKERAKKEQVVPYDETRFQYDSGMPYTAEQEKEFVKFMIKNKTDVLTDGRDFYTRMGDNWCEISHPKLYRYKEFMRTQGLEDCKETWEAYVKK